MQQLKQYKKQADHLRDELGTHKEVHALQKEQVSAPTPDTCRFIICCCLKF